jgi:hypothetical protein
MSTEQRFRLNEPNVIQEVIDGEAIIADLGRGLYFSLDALGSRIWHALISGCSVGAICEVCCQRYSAEATRDILHLLDCLREEQLVVEDTIAVNGTGAATFFDGFEGPYVPPQLSKYTDMEQLLLLDPIHEVDETGWPNQPGAPAAEG